MVPHSLLGRSSAQSGARVIQSCLPRQLPPSTGTSPGRLHQRLPSHACSFCPQHSRLPGCRGLYAGRAERSSITSQATRKVPAKTEDSGPLLLVDGQALAFRAYYHHVNNASQTKSPSGTPISVTLSVLKVLQAAIANIKPRAVVVVFESADLARRDLLAALTQLKALDGTPKELDDEAFVSLCEALQEDMEEGVLPVGYGPLLQHIKDLLPQGHPAAIALDTPGDPSLYKPGRYKMPPVFHQDVHNLQCVLAALRIPCITRPNCDAEDTLDALRMAANEQGVPSEVVSMHTKWSSDLKRSTFLKLLPMVLDEGTATTMQLICSMGNPDDPGAISVPDYGWESQRVTEAEVEDVFSVSGSGVTLLTALAGNESDGIPGVQGLGEASAKAVLREYESLEDVYEALDEGTLKGKKLIKALALGRKDAYLSYLLANGTPAMAKLTRADVLPLLQPQGCRLEEVTPVLQRLGVTGLDLNVFQKGLGGPASQPLASQQLAQAMTLQESASPSMTRRSPGRSPGPQTSGTGTGAAAGAARSPAPLSLPFETFIDSISATRVTQLGRFEQAVEDVMRQLGSGEGQTPSVAVHVEMVKLAKGKSLPPGSNKALAVSSITVCYDTEQQPAAGDTSHELSAVVFEFPEGCLQPTAPDHATARTAVTALWKLMSSDKVVKVVHDGKSLHRLGAELGLGVVNTAVTAPHTQRRRSKKQAAPAASPAPAAQPTVPETATRRRGRRPSTASSSPPLAQPVPPPFSASSPASAPEDPMSAARPLGFTQGCISGVCAPILDTMLACYLADLERNKESELSVGVLSTGFSVQTASELQAKVTGLTATASPAALAAAATTAQIWALATQMLKHKRVHVDMPALLKTTQSPNHVPDAADRLGPTAAGWRLLTDLEQPLQEVLADIEKTGLLIDKDVLLKIEQDTVAKQEEVVAEILQIANIKSFNPNSPDQISDLLFNKLKLPTTGIEKTSTGRLSTGENTLRTLRDKHVVVDLIVQHRSLNVMRNTYLNPLLVALEQSHDGRVHTTYNQTGAVTGRLSSTDPNLQNIPKHDSFYAPLLDAYKPEPGWLILNADYAQMELRQLAALSGEQPMVEAFRTNQDVHKETARLLFGLASVDQVTKEQRQIGKVVNFGIIYGMGPTQLAMDLGHGSDTSRAKHYIQSIRTKYPRIDYLMRRNEILAVTKGYVETRFGRRRYFQFRADELAGLRGVSPDQVQMLPSMKSVARIEDSMRLRQAGNYPIQGTSADIIKRAMVNMSAELHMRGLKSRMLLTIHDALVLEVPPEEVDTVRSLVQQCMDGADGGLLSLVPLKSEIKVNEAFKQAYC